LRSRSRVEPVQGRIHIEKINEPVLFRDGARPAEYGVGLRLAIERGWLTMNECGTFVIFSPRPEPGCSPKQPGHGSEARLGRE
jgi:hypothetical protein